MLCIRDVTRGRTLALAGLKHGRLVLTALVYNHLLTKIRGLYSFHALYIAHLVLSPKTMISMLDIFMIG